MYKETAPPCPCPVGRPFSGLFRVFHAAALVFVTRRAAWNGVAALEPAREVNVGAALRTEGRVLRICRLVADGAAFGAHDVLQTFGLPGRRSSASTVQRAPILSSSDVVRAGRAASQSFAACDSKPR